MSTVASAKQQIQQARESVKPKEEPTNPEFQKLLEKAVGRTATYKPLGESSEITLSVAIVRQHFAPKTASGKEPTDAQLTKFVMLCRAQLLNPWLGECILNGYDTKDGPVFQIITTQQALRKRAERNQHFDGLESGIVVVTADGTLTERNGEILLPKERLVGAWCKVYRRDRRFPFYRTINLDGYDQKRARWNADKPGMIRKCAESASLKQAFPLECGGLIIEGETPEEAEYVDRQPEARSVQVEPEESAARDIDSQAEANPTVPGDDAPTDLVAHAEKLFARCTTVEELKKRAAEIGTTYQLTPEQDQAIEAKYGIAKEKLQRTA